MPEEVAARLDDALAAAAAEPLPGAVTTLPTLQPRRDRSRSRWLAAAAAVVVLAGVGIGIGVSTGGTKKHDTIPTALAGGGAIDLPADVPVAATSRDYATPDAVKTDVRALITGQLTPAPSGIVASVRAAASEAAEGKAALADSAARPAAPAAGANPSAVPQAAAPLYASAQLSADLLGGELAQCLQSLGQGDKLVGVERASYQGKPSLFVAFRDATNLSTVDVYIVGRSCDGLPPDGVRTVLRVTLS
jgi:hypothetical protein